MLQGKIGQYRALLKTHGIPDTVAPDDSFLAADMAALVASESAVEERDTDPDSGDVGEEGAMRHDKKYSGYSCDSVKVQMHLPAAQGSATHCHR